MKRMTWLILFLIAPCCMANSEKVYRRLIEKSLNQQPLCLGEKHWPVSIKPGSDQWINAKMEALVDAGLITPHIETGKKIWNLTEYGRRLFSKKHDFCYGTIRVRAISKNQTGKGGITLVEFTYYIDALPAWAKNHSIRVANTDLDNLVTGIDSVRYMAKFSQDSRGKMKMLNEPEQLDLYY
ncbi:CpmK protein [Leclercia sp. 29361]|uniref:CpmK protein n=1 Tax=Leclercia sp. 29361 TaxID=2714951 RepID=UPI00140A7EEC|nr:CpmK protein [Leclercia sp. 29361]QIK14050.1 CpmK protein [Leclercia sp. 29361]